MWITVLIQAALFAVQHLPELFSIISAIMSFFRAHKNNPDLAQWVSEFSAAMSEAKLTHDPKPVRDFLLRLEAQFKGETK